MEEFKVIPDFPRYSISNLGNVINNVTGRIISQRKASNGYMRFNVRKGDVEYEKPTTLHTHRAVAELFLPKVDGKPYINHKDADKTNNRVDNLEWCTAQENSQHAYKAVDGLAEIYHINIVKAQEAVCKPIAVYKDGVLIATYKSERETAKALGISIKTITNAMRGMKNRKGYEFKRI